MAVMLALGMSVNCEKKVAVKPPPKPQMGTTPSTDFLGEIAQHVNIPPDIASEMATDLSTCGGDDGYDTLTIVDTKEAVDMEIMNNNAPQQHRMDNVTLDQSIAVQALEEISCVPPNMNQNGNQASCVNGNQAPNVNPVYTTMSVVYPHSENTHVNASGHVQNDTIQINSSDLESVLRGVHGNDVLMVVADPNDSDKKSILTYEVAQQAMLAYAQAQTESSHQHFNNVGIIGMNQQDGGIAVASMKVDENKLEMAPEELILRMSEEMHKVTN